MTMIGSVGVTLLLLAFLANLAGRLEARSKLNQGLNAVGAGLRRLCLVRHRLHAFRGSRRDLVRRCDCRAPSSVSLTLFFRLGRRDPAQQSLLDFPALGCIELFEKVHLARDHRCYRHTVAVENSVACY